MTKKSKTFKLHYIGKEMYNIDVFEREAQRHGVQRAVSFSQLKTLKFGIPVLLASYIKPIPTTNTEQISKKGISSVLPSAEVFGYFTLDGISHNLPKDLSQLLQSKLSIIKTEESPFSVSRACGSYSVGSITYIKEDLSTLLKKIQELFTIHKKEFTNTAQILDSKVCTCPKCKSKTHSTPEALVDLCLDLSCECCTSVNYNEINSYKWFINGKYYPLTPFVLTPAKFARGIQTVTIDDLNLEKQKKSNSSIVWLYNYRQRHYISKTMRNRLKQPKDYSDFF